jgi:hypothetical protein
VNYVSRAKHFGGGNPRSYCDFGTAGAPPTHKVMVRISPPPTGASNRAPIGAISLRHKCLQPNRNTALDFLVRAGEVHIADAFYSDLHIRSYFRAGRTFFRKDYQRRGRPSQEM